MLPQPLSLQQQHLPQVAAMCLMAVTWLVAVYRYHCDFWAGSRLYSKYCIYLTEHCLTGCRPVQSFTYSLISLPPTVMGVHNSNLTPKLNCRAHHDTGPPIWGTQHSQYKITITTLTQTPIDERFCGPMNLNNASQPANNKPSPPQHGGTSLHFSLRNQY